MKLDTQPPSVDPITVEPRKGHELLRASSYRYDHLPPPTLIIIGLLAIKTVNPHAWPAFGHVFGPDPTDAVPHPIPARICTSGMKDVGLDSVLPTPIGE